MGFKTRQTGEESWLLLDPVRSFNEIIFSIFGACLFALAVYLMGLSIVRQVTAHDHMLVPSFIFGAVMVFLAWALCHTDAQVLAVARCRDRIKIKVRFAVYLRRCVSFRAGKPGVLSDR